MSSKSDIFSVIFGMSGSNRRTELSNHIRQLIQSQLLFPLYFLPYASYMPRQQKPSAFFLLFMPCTQLQEWHARSESRAEELVAIQETLKLLADDEVALDLLFSMVRGW